MAHVYIQYFGGFFNSSQRSKGAGSLLIINQPSENGEEVRGAFVLFLRNLRKSAFSLCVKAFSIIADGLF